MRRKKHIFDNKGIRMPVSLILRYSREEMVYIERNEEEGYTNEKTEGKSRFLCPLKLNKSGLTETFSLQPMEIF